MSMLKMFQTAVGKQLQETPSAITNWLGGKLLEVEQGFLKVEYTVRADMLNPMQSLHGGIMSLMHDDVIGMCVLTLDREVPYTSINLTVDFLKSARLDDTIIHEVKVERAGNKVIYLHSTLYKLKNEEQVLISKATSNMLRFD